MDNIHEGDSWIKVAEVLGTPDRVSDSVRIPGATAWYYSSFPTTCGFTMDNGIVRKMACENSIMSGGAAVLGGLGSGLSNVGRKTVNCTTTVSGDTAYSTCH